jgi:hypothetical protein
MGSLLEAMVQDIGQVWKFAGREGRFTPALIRRQRVGPVMGDFRFSIFDF